MTPCLTISILVGLVIRQIDFEPFITAVIPPKRMDMLSFTFKISGMQNLWEPGTASPLSHKMTQISCHILCNTTFNPLMEYALLLIFWLLPRPKLHNWLDTFLLSLSFCSLSLFLGSSGSSSMEQVSWLMLPRAPWRFEFHMRDPSFHIFALWRGISYLKHRITTSWIPPPPKFPINTLFGDNFLLIQYQHIKQS